jgi:hypothetical protein
VRPGTLADWRERVQRALGRQRDVDGAAETRHRDLAKVRVALGGSEPDDGRSGSAEEITAPKVLGSCSPTRDQISASSIASLST